MSDVDEIKDRLNIVDVVSGYVTLRKAGRNYKAICPFHTEKTPSFVVNPERQMWRCFGACGTGGDAFSFVMRAEKLEFGEALKLLADRTGVTLRQRGEGEGDREEGLYRVNGEAVTFYQKVLASPDGATGLSYLEHRGVDPKTRSAFQLGASPSGRSPLMEHLRSLGYNLEIAVEAGLLKREEDGRLRDFFWGRLMFPIHDRKARVTGFGARTLDGSDPKYINTAATPIFDKRATLYGLHMAASSLRDQGTAVVVEGYMDTIAAHQFGHSNVVASMGTALTDRQVYQLRSMAKHLVQALDPDVAGQEATLHSLESSYRVLERRRLGQRLELELRIASLPAGRDPDQLIREDPEEWERVVGGAMPFMEFLIPAKASRYDLSTASGKAQAAEALLPVIMAEDNSLKQDEYFQMLADALGVGRQALEASIGRPRRTGYARSRADPARAPAIAPLEGDRQDLLEDYVLSLLLRRPDLKEGAETLAPEHFRRTENRMVFTHWLACTTMDELREQLDAALHAHVDYLDEMDVGPIDSKSAAPALAQSVRRMEQRHLREVQEGLLESEDATEPPSRELEEPIVNVNARLKELYSQGN